MYLCLNHLCKKGLVAGVFKKEELVDQAVKVAARIASYSQVAALLVKESVNNCTSPRFSLSFSSHLANKQPHTAFEMTLKEACHFERRLFHSTFATVRLTRAGPSINPLSLK